MVADAETLAPVPRDGETLGEVFLRGNIVMKGYLKNPQASEAAFEGGWFHSGDLGVWHPDGYIELKDRSKDIIISGGENISSIEVEGALYKHPAVARPPWSPSRTRSGARPPAPSSSSSPAPRPRRRRSSPSAATTWPTSSARATWSSAELPKTSTGKIQKFVLRERAEGV